MANIAIADFVEDESAVRIYWNSHDGNGAAAAASGGTVRIYKDGGTTEHTTTGVTDTRDFDTITGANLIVIDTSAHAFFAVGSEFAVLLDGATIDTQTVTAWLGHFTIGASDVYGARIAWVRESSAAQSIWVPSIEFNGQSLGSSDVSNVQIRVYHAKTGADTIALTAMTQGVGEASWYIDLSATLLDAGVPYVAELQFDHKGRADRQTFREALYRDAA